MAQEQLDHSTASLGFDAHGQAVATLGRDAVEHLDVRLWSM